MIITIVIVCMCFILSGIAGAMALFGRKIKSGLAITETKFKIFNIWLIVFTFTLVAVGIVFELGIKITSVGFLIILGSLFIWTLQNIRKGKETNWWTIAAMCVVIGFVILIFQNPETKQIAEEKGYVRGPAIQAWRFAFGKSEPKPAPHVATFQRIASGEFIGKGFGKDEKIHTGWFLPETARQGDVVKYQIPKGAYIELPNDGVWHKWEGKEVRVNVLSNMGELTFKAPEGTDIYVELWGVR